MRGRQYENKCMCRSPPPHLQYNERQIPELSANIVTAERTARDEVVSVYMHNSSPGTGHLTGLMYIASVCRKKRLNGNDRLRPYETG